MLENKFKLSPLGFFYQEILPRLTPELAFPEVDFAKKSGTDWRGKCPMHNGDNTTSFSLDPRTFRWHCFSCNQSGDYFSFKNQGTYPRGKVFTELLKNAAKLVSIPLPNWGVPSEEENKEWKREVKRDQIFDQFLEITHEYLLKNTKTTKRAKRFLLDRGITEEQIDNLPFGCYHCKLDNLIKMIEKKGYNKDDFIEFGLIPGKHSKPEHKINAWTGRLICGVRDRWGQLNTFWARDLSGDVEEKEKYLYLRGTKKREIGAFGLDVAARSIRDKKSLILVEGVFDPIIYQANGLTNIAAIGGSGSEMSFDRWETFSNLGINNVTLVLDNDRAGKEGTLTAITNAFKVDSSLILSVVNPGDLGEFKDPGEYFEHDKDNAVDWLNSLVCDNAVPASEYIVSNYLHDITPNRSEAKRQKASKEILSLLANSTHRLTATEEGEVLQKIKKATGFKLADLKSDLTTEKTKQSEVNKRKSEDSVVDKLIKYMEDWELYRCEDKLIARFNVSSHHETLLLNERSNELRRYLVYTYSENEDGQPNSESLKIAMQNICARARFEGKKCTTFTRIGWHDNKTYLDLCDDEWNTVEISDEGWELLQEPAPCIFLRSKGMEPLPIPKGGGKITKIRHIINYGNKNTLILLIGWLMGTLSRGPYAHLIITGPPGSAKSSTMKYLCSLIDPNVKIRKGLPKDYRDLAITSEKSHIITFDNISVLSPNHQDIMCRIATGDSFSTRMLYSDDDEIIKSLKSPIILNGINNPASQKDLLDRSIVTPLPRIGSDKRKSEEECNRFFEIYHPQILGAILDGVSKALYNLPHIELETNPRLMDFCKFVEAAMPAFGIEEGKFTRLFNENQNDHSPDFIIRNPIVQTLIELLKENNLIEMNPTELYEELSRISNDSNSAGWPGSPSALSRFLHKHAAHMKELGINYKKGKDNKGNRRINIWLSDIH